MRLPGSIVLKVAFILCIPVIFEITIIASSMHLLGEIDKAREESRKVSSIISLYADTLSLMMRDYFRFLDAVSTGEKMSQAQCDRIYNRTCEAANKLGLAGYRDGGFDYDEVAKRKTILDKKFPVPVDGLDQNVFREGIAHAHLVTDLLEAAEKTINRRAKLFQEKEQTERDTFLRMNSLLLAALAVSLLLTLGLGLMINRLLLNRLAIVSENTRRFALDKPLLPPLRGDDEVAQLDRTFRAMAQTLSRARQKDLIILENSQDIIAALDENLCFQKVSKAAELIWQKEEQDLVNHHISEIIYSESQVHTLSMLDEAKASGAVTRFENETISSSGNQIPSSWSVKWSEEENLYVAVIHDLRNRKEAERQKQDLLAMVSHDLKSPLTTVTLSIETLLKASELEPKAHDELTTVNSSVEHVVAVTNDLVDLLRIQQNKVDLNLSLVSAKKCKALLEECLKNKNIPGTVNLLNDEETLLVLDEDYFQRAVLALARHLRLACGEGTVIIELITEAPSVIFKIESEKAEVKNEPTESKRISWEISIGLSREIVKRLQGDLLTFWRADGLPVYNLILPVCHQEES